MDKICRERRQSALFTATGEYRDKRPKFRKEQKDRYIIPGWENNNNTERWHHHSLHKTFIAKIGSLHAYKNWDDLHWSIHIHTCSLLYSLTITGTLVGGTCQDYIVKSFIFRDRKSILSDKGKMLLKTIKISFTLQQKQNSYTMRINLV